MNENLEFPLKIRYTDDSFSMGQGSFVNGSTIKSQIINKEDLDSVSENEIETMITLFNEDKLSTREVKGRITNIDKETGFIFINIEGQV